MRYGTYRAARSLCGIIFRPGPTIRAISAEPDGHLAPAIAVLAASVLASVALPNPFFGGGAELDARVGASIVTGSALSHIAVISGIFLIGRAWGGNRRLARALALLPYCLFPSLLATVSLGILAGPLSVLPPPADGTGEPVSGPEFQFYLRLALNNAVGAVLFAWTFLLYAKAIRVMNGFGIARTAALLALSVLITYGTSFAHGLAFVALTELA